MWRLCLGISLAGCLLGAEPVLTMRVQNGAGVPGRTLARAEKIAGAILHQVGLDVVWVDAVEAGDRSLGPAEFRLHIVDKRPARLAGDAAGYALIFPAETGAENYAGVSYPMVRDIAASLQTCVERMMGITMAHEIGHLLLGSKAHSRRGIMSPAFRGREVRQAEKGELGFTVEEGARVREAVRRREGRELNREPSVNPSPAHSRFNVLDSPMIETLQSRQSAFVMDRYLMSRHGIINGVIIR
jgi:hypothetical protein